MKVFGFTVLLISVSLSAVSAQGTSKYVTAYNYLQDGNYLKAKEYIDKAIEYEDAQGKAKTWMIRGDVYARMASAQEGVDYGITPTDAAIVAVESYTKAASMDTRRIDETMLLANLKRYATVLFSYGVDAYNEKNYLLALQCFSVSAEGTDALGETDSLATYNMGLCNENLGNDREAIVNYKQCISSSHLPELCYQSIVMLYRGMNEDAMALATVNEALQAYPNNGELRTSKVNLLLAAGRQAEAIPHLDRLLEDDANNAVLLFSRGTCHTNVGNAEKAIGDFKRALGINPDYFDVAYNLGAAYFNLGVDMSNEASETSDSDVYEAKKKEADSYFQQAQIYLEQALELSPTNSGVMQSLVQIYVRAGDTEKYKAMKARLENE